MTEITTETSWCINAVMANSKPKGGIAFLKSCFFAARCRQRNEKSKRNGQDGLRGISVDLLISTLKRIWGGGGISHAAALAYSAAAANLYSLGAACC